MKTNQSANWNPKTYRECAEALENKGWICTGGMYPDSNASDHDPVTWVGRFERKNGNTVETFMLSSGTVGSHAFQRAIGL